MGNKELMSLEDVYNIIKDRREKMPEGSRVASFFKEGMARMAQKVGEEGIEVAIAATILNTTGTGREKLIGETADLLFRSLIVLVGSDITLEEVFEELTIRNQEKAR